MGDHHITPDAIGNDCAKRQAREALRRQIGIWLSRTIPEDPRQAARPALEMSGGAEAWDERRG